MKITDKRRQWIKSLSPGHMEEAMLSDDERCIWIQSRTREEMAQYLEWSADKLERGNAQYARKAFDADSDQHMWLSKQLRTSIAIHRINARRCREGKRLISRAVDDN